MSPRPALALAPVILLLASLPAVAAAGTPADEVPSIDGDPFTGTQEYPTAFRAGAAKVPGTAARVPVGFTGPGKVKSQVVVVLSSGPGGWRIDDVEEPRGGPSLRKLLADRPAPRP